MIPIPIIDTHLHIWDPQHLHYPWLSGEPTLNRAYLPKDYRQATEGLSIQKMIFLQCDADFAQYQVEADWVTEQAQKESRIKGIVAWAPVENGANAHNSLATLKKNPLVKGIRRLIQSESDPAFCLQHGFVQGVRILSEFDLHFEICLKGDDQFKNAMELVRECPQVRFILDHIGKPFIKEKRMDPWAGYIKELSDLPNAWCKISGLVTEADPEQWTPEDLRPYIDHVIESFGFDRIMFGGDWPVCTLASTYRRWAETLWDAVSGCSEVEQRKLLHDNAEKFYCI